MIRSTHKTTTTSNRANPEASSLPNPIPPQNLVLRLHIGRRRLHRHQQADHRGPSRLLLRGSLFLLLRLAILRDGDGAGGGGMIGDDGGWCGREVPREPLRLDANLRPLPSILQQ
ncbi:unnamed protein product, partial [Linum tenue]